jgi:nitroreductase
VERFMGLDPVREGCLAIIRCAGAEPVHPPLEEERTEDLARGSRCAILDDPPQAILDVHDRTRHDDGSGVVDFSSLLTTRANAVNLHGAEWSESGCPLPDCIAERRSRRNYVPRNIPREFVEAMLRLMRLDEDRGGPWRYAPAGLLVQNVTGLDAGFYLPTDGGHGPVIHGSMMREMARICLEQMWLMSASLHVMFLADLAALERSLGPIGYRVAMLSAGRLGQRVYLGAVQHDLGACGIGAYFDDEAERFLHLGASEKMLYMVAAGPVKK